MTLTEFYDKASNEIDIIKNESNIHLIKRSLECAMEFSRTINDSLLNERLNVTSDDAKRYSIMAIEAFIKFLKQIHDRAVDKT